MPLSDALLSKYAATLLAFTKWERSGVSKCTLNLAQPVGLTQARWLRDLGLTRPFAVITACNPGGKIATEAENDRAATLLTAAVQALAADTSVACLGCSPDMLHIEPGLAVKLDQPAALELARQFKQLAIYWFDGQQFWIVPTAPGASPVPLPLERHAANP